MEKAGTHGPPIWSDFRGVWRDPRTADLVLIFNGESRDPRTADLVGIFQGESRDPRTADLVGILKGEWRDLRTAESVRISKKGLQGPTDSRFGPNFKGTSRDSRTSESIRIPAEIRTELAVRVSLHSPLKIPTKSAVPAFPLKRSSASKMFSLKNYFFTSF